jgi:hypothetical protein
MKTTGAMKRGVAGIGIGVLAALAGAGQVHRHYYGFAEVARGHDGAEVCVLSGTLIAVDTDTRRVRLRIEKAWASPNHTARCVKNEEVEIDGERYGKIVDIPVSPGDTVAVEVYTGITWTDPRKSPIERRLWGHLPLSEAAPGQAVVYIERELVARDEIVERKLGLFFGGHDMDAFLRDASIELLAACLDDPDLYDGARHALARRGESVTGHILRGGRGRVDDHDPLERHFLALDTKERRAFFAEAAALKGLGRDSTRLTWLLEVVSDHLSAADLPAVHTLSALVKRSAVLGEYARTRFTNALERAGNEGDDGDAPGR